MMLRVADGMVIGIPPGNLFSATFGAAHQPPRSFSGGSGNTGAQAATREAAYDICRMDITAPMAQSTPHKEIGERKMTGNVIPLSSRDSSGEKRALLTDDDIRLITEVGNKLIHDGKASAIRRYTERSGQDVMVILDDKGVIEFGIEKSVNGYKRFNCDCDTVATSAELLPLLSDLI